MSYESDMQRAGRLLAEEVKLRDQGKTKEVGPLKHTASVRSDLQELSADPFDEWWQRPNLKPFRDNEEAARAAWNAATEHEREEYTKRGKTS